MWAALRNAATAMTRFLFTSAISLGFAWASIKSQRMRSSSVAGRPMMQLSDSRTHDPSEGSNIGRDVPFKTHAGAFAGSLMLGMISIADCTKMSKSFVAPAVVRKSRSPSRASNFAAPSASPPVC